MTGVIGLGARILSRIYSRKVSGNNSISFKEKVMNHLSHFVNWLLAITTIEILKTLCKLAIHWKVKNIIILHQRIIADINI